MTDFEKLTLKLLSLQLEVAIRTAAGRYPASDTEATILHDLRREVEDAVNGETVQGRRDLWDINLTLVSQIHHSGGHLVGLVFPTEAQGIATMHAVTDLVRADMIQKPKGTT